MRAMGQDERRGGTVGFPVARRGPARGGTTARLPWARPAISRCVGQRVQGLLAHAREDGRGVHPDGWFKTGDVGVVDERGYVRIVGRSKDLIISGGYNVYPAEVEGYINELPGVAESALVGVPHPDFGEVGVAVVIALAGRLQPEAIVAQPRPAGQLQDSQRCFVSAELPQHHGQGAEEPAARAVPGLFAD